MKTKVIVRYVSGREEQFDVDVFWGGSPEGRLKEFLKNPTLVLQTEKEIVIIPATAVESITLSLPESAGQAIGLPNLRKAKRLK
jgi:hypothetical protein